MRSLSPYLPSLRRRLFRWLAVAAAAVTVQGVTGSALGQDAAQPTAPEPTNTGEVKEDHPAKLKTEEEHAPQQIPDGTPASKVRTISRAQASAFVDALRDAPHGKVTVSAAEGDGEAHQFAVQLAALLQHTSYSPRGLPVAEIPVAQRPANHPAVFLFVSARTPIPAYAMAIKEALELIGVRSDFAYVEPVGRPGDLQIAVYGKP